MIFNKEIIRKAGVYHGALRMLFDDYMNHAQNREVIEVQIRGTLERMKGKGLDDCVDAYTHIFEIVKSNANNH